MTTFIIIHFSLMVLAIVFIIAAVLIVRAKKGPNWLKKHRLNALLAAACSVVSLITIIINNQSLSFPHLSSPHAIAGAITMPIVLLTPFIGYLFTKGKKKLRTIHIILGKLTLAVMIATAMFGVLNLATIMAWI